MQWLLRWFVSAVALYVTVLLGRSCGIPGFRIAPGALGVEGMLLFVLILGVSNAVLRPVIRFLTLPFTCLTFGLFAFVVNALLFWLAARFESGFRVVGWEAPLFGSVVMGLISGALNFLVMPDREKKRR